MVHILRRWSGRAAATVLVAQVAAAAAHADVCDDWLRQHVQYEAEIVRGYLTGASQESLDNAVFELLQREAYLTSCDLSVDFARRELVGYRLAGRTPDEYGAAVVESVLEKGGLDLGLRSLLPAHAEPAASVARRSARDVRR
jgi:hypothetical protein